MQVVKNMHAYNSLINIKTTAELRSHLIPQCFSFEHKYEVRVMPHPGGSPSLLLAEQRKVFAIDGQASARLRSYPGHTMRFDLSHPSNRHFTMAFSATPDGTHTNGGVEITNPPAGGERSVIVCYQPALFILLRPRAINGRAGFHF